MIIYVIMESVDLGGNPISAYQDKTKAENCVDQLNRGYEQAQIERLISGCNYSRENAELWIKNHPQRYYLEEIPLEQS